MLISNFRDLETPSGSKFRWIKVYDKSPDHVQPLESSNLNLNHQIIKVLSSLHPMDENPGQHEQVSCLKKQKEPNELDFYMAILRGSWSCLLIPRNC